jgi:hypothetical protein
LVVDFLMALANLMAVDYPIVVENLMALANQNLVVAYH